MTHWLCSLTSTKSAKNSPRTVTVRNWIFILPSLTALRSMHSPCRAAMYYVTRGILAYLNPEAELAAVLGHEIGHVTARHSVRQYSAATAANAEQESIRALEIKTITAIKGLSYVRLGQGIPSWGKCRKLLALAQRSIP
jgi:hypothetical protein